MASIDSRARGQDQAWTAAVSSHCVHTLGFVEDKSIVQQSVHSLSPTLSTEFVQNIPEKTRLVLFRSPGRVGKIGCRMTRGRWALESGHPARGDHVSWSER